MSVANLGRLGAGLGYRREIKRATLEAHAQIDFLEIIAEQFFYSEAAAEELAELRESFHLVPHGLGLSVGSAAAPSPRYLRAIQWLCEKSDAPYYSEHLAVTRVPGIDLGHLSPVVYSRQMLEVVATNVERVQQLIGRPLVLENITYDLALPGSDLSQPEFFCELTRRTGCGVLLDLANLHINSVNHGFDADAFLRAMPLEHIVQVHLAGGSRRGARLVDSHSEPVGEGVWALLERLVSLAPLRAAIVERDANMPALSELLEEVALARRLMAA